MLNTFRTTTRVIIPVEITVKIIVAEADDTLGYKWRLNFFLISNFIVLFIKKNYGWSLSGFFYEEFDLLCFQFVHLLPSFDIVLNIFFQFVCNPLSDVKSIQSLI